MRIAILTEIPAPFRGPLFNELARHVELRVLFLSGDDPKRPYPLHADEFQFAWRILPGWSHVTRGTWVMVSRRVGRELRRFRPDVVVVGGWNQPAFWRALVHGRLRRRTVLCWVESTARDLRPGSPLRERAKSIFVRACNGFLVPGEASREYLLAMGVPDGRIAIAPNAVDAAIFRSNGPQARQRDDVRRRLEIDGYVVLTVARLAPEKSLDLLIRAVAALAPGVELVVAGVGELTGELESLAHELAPGRVRFIGFVSREALAEWYAAADVFALPSQSEQWGMALSEAATAGLPLIASEAVGAGRELIEDGVNGFRIPVGDEPALVRALERLRDDVTFRTAAGARSRALAAAHTPQAWSDAVVELATRLRATQPAPGGRDG